MREGLYDVENVRPFLLGAFFAAAYKAVELFKCGRYTGKRSETVFLCRK